MRIAWRQPLVGLLAFAQTFVPLLQTARANPRGGQTVAGSATIQGQGTANVIVNQSSPSAIINWGTFNIGSGEITRFLQPSVSSYTLNRVTGSQSPSQILGTIEANGRIFLVNPDGFIFGTGAKINTASFLATTHDISNANFMAGNFTFNIPGNPNAYILNQGTITASSGGFAALVAPAVRNEGVIVANLGTVALAGAGKGFVLDLYGDSLIKLYAGDTVSGTVLSSVLSNTGTLQANGGKVLLTAATAQKVVDSVINMSGVIEAQSVGMQNGMVVFGAQTASTKASGAPAQTVKISGTVDVSGKNAGETGGTVQITGELITLQSAFIDASGANGGGKILVGGDYGGGAANAPAVTQYGQSFEASAIPNATTVSVDAASILNVSALMNGNGGKAVLWSDHGTIFLGTVKATGGLNGGNGGFVEISSPTSLVASGITDVSAPRGKPGMVLFDPNDVYVVSSLPGCVSSNSCGTNSYILASSLSAGFSTVSGVNVAIDASVGSSGPLSFVATSNLYVNAAVYSATLLGLSGANVFLSAPVSSPNGTVSISETDISVTPLFLSFITAKNIALYGTNLLSLTAPVNVTGSLTLSTPTLVVDQSLSAGDGISLLGSSSVAINAPVTANGVIPGQQSLTLNPGVSINSPHITINNVVTANNSDISLTASIVDGDPNSGRLATNGWVSANYSGSLLFNLPLNLAGNFYATASDLTIASNLTVGGGIILNGTNSVTLNAPVLSNNVIPSLWAAIESQSLTVPLVVLPSTNSLRFNPSIEVHSPNLTVNNTLSASKADILADAKVVSGAGTLTAPNGWVVLGNSTSVISGVGVNANGFAAVAPSITLNGDVTSDVLYIAASSSLSGSAALTLNGTSDNLAADFFPPLLLSIGSFQGYISSPSITMSGPWTFANAYVAVPGAQTTLSGPLSLTNSTLELGYQWPDLTWASTTFTLNNSFQGTGSTQIIGYTGLATCASSSCTSTMNINGDITGGSFQATSFNLNALQGKNQQTISSASFAADGDINLLAPTVNFSGYVSARAFGNFNISSLTLNFPATGSQGFPTVALTGYDMNFSNSPTITGVGALTGYDAISTPSYIVIANSSNAPAGGAPSLMTADHINAQLSLAHDLSLTLDVTTLLQNVTTGPNSLLNITGRAITIDGAIALGSNSSLFVNSGVYLSKTSSATTGALTINGNITAAQNTSSSPVTVGLASAGDLILNGQVDVSQLSPGSTGNPTPFAVYFVAGGSVFGGSVPYAQLSGTTGNIVAGPNAKVIGGNGVLTFAAAQGVGTSTNPIPVTAAPFSNSNASNQVSCALGLLVCGNGGTLVTAVGPSALLLPPQGAFFLINGNIGSLPSSGGGSNSGTSGGNGSGGQGNNGSGISPSELLVFLQQPGNNYLATIGNLYNPAFSPVGFDANGNLIWTTPLIDNGPDLINWSFFSGDASADASGPGFSRDKNPGNGPASTSGAFASANAGAEVYVIQAQGGNENINVMVDVVAAEAKVDATIGKGGIEAEAVAEVVLIDVNATTNFTIGEWIVDVGGTAGISAGGSAKFVFNPTKMKYGGKLKIGAGPGFGVNVDIQQVIPQAQ